MLRRLAELLAILPGEGRMAGLLLGVMLVTSAGSAVGSAGVDTLFFARFGVQYLPYMYMLLGGVTMAASLGVTAWLGRLPARRLYILLPLLLGLFLLAARLLLLLDLRLIHPVLWLGKEVVNTLIGFTVWGAAGVVCNPRQARRLFPLFGAGRILGTVLGGLATAWFVSLAGTENLLLLWMGTMLLAFLLSRLLLGSVVGLPPPRRHSRNQPPAFIREIGEGYQYIRGSRLMRWVSVASVLFSILFFSLALPFSRSATLQFPDEAALAGFLGAFQGASTAAAFLASLLLANRLFARFGIMTMILVFPLIYLIGFGAMVAAPVFVVIAGFRFVQTLWLSGIADPAYQAVFNVVPPARRDQVRTFMGGVPDQAGTFIAGLVLLIGEQAFTASQLALIGFLAAAACAYVIWQARRAYHTALVEALRAGRPQVFFSEEEPFGGFRRDSEAQQTLLAGLRDEDHTVRRVATEILTQVHISEAIPLLIGALQDEDASVRIHALRALSHGQSPTIVDGMIGLLADQEPEVRMEALRSLSKMGLSADRFLPILEALLQDPSPSIRIRAAAGRLKIGPHPPSSRLLHEAITQGDDMSRIAALEVSEDVGLIASQTGHSQPAVRGAAVSALRRAAGIWALPDLLEMLANPEARDQAAREISALGEPAVNPTLKALSDPAREAGALTALASLPMTDPRPVEAFIHEAAGRARHYEALRQAIRASTREAGLLQEVLGEKARLYARHALLAVGLLDGRETVTVALENLSSADAGQRAAALEALESLGERWRELIRPLLALWDEASARAPTPAEAPFSRLFADPDPWVRACSAYAACQLPDRRLDLEKLRLSDPDPLVRQAAGLVLKGDASMQTLPTLSLMERVLFFRRVPLFEGLSTADLKQVAELSEEVEFSRGEEIARQDEPGDTMYLVVSGKISVQTGPANGEKHEIARRGSGDYVGEMALISQMPRMASLVAAGEVRALSIGQKSFQGLLRERPEVCLTLMKELCKRVTELSQRAWE